MEDISALMSNTSAIIKIPVPTPRDEESIDDDIDCEVVSNRMSHALPVQKPTQTCLKSHNDRQTSKFGRGTVGFSFGGEKLDMDHFS